MTTLMVARDAAEQGDEATRTALLNELLDVQHVRMNYRVPGVARKFWRRMAGRNEPMAPGYTDAGMLNWKIRRPDEVEIAQKEKGGPVYGGESVLYANRWRVKMRELRKEQGCPYPKWWDEL